MVFFPPGNASHVTGSLRLVALLTKDLQVPAVPLVAPHGDWADVIQHIRVTPIVTYFLFAASTFTLLYFQNRPSHLCNGGSLLIPVRIAAGGLTTPGVPVSGFEIFPLTPTMGTCSTGEPISLLGSVGKPAVLTVHHVYSY